MPLRTGWTVPISRFTAGMISVASSSMDRRGLGKRQAAKADLGHVTAGAERVMNFQQFLDDLLRAAHQEAAAGFGPVIEGGARKMLHRARHVLLKIGPVVRVESVPRLLRGGRHVEVAAGPHLQGAGVVAGVGGRLAVELHQPAEPGGSGQQGNEQGKTQPSRPRRNWREFRRRRPTPEACPGPGAARCPSRECSGSASPARSRRRCPAIPGAAAASPRRGRRSLPIRGRTAGRTR